MRVRFFNGNDPSRPPGHSEALMIGIAEDENTGQEREVVRVATSADVATYGVAYGNYEKAMQAAEKAEKEAGHQPSDENKVLQPEDAPPADAPPAAPHPAPAASPGAPAQHEPAAAHPTSHEAQRTQPQPGGSGRR